MGWIFGIIYFVLMVTLGVVSLRKGHWVMFIVGVFIPIFWFIGALLPRRVVVFSGQRPELEAHRSGSGEQAV